MTTEERLLDEIIELIDLLARHGSSIETQDVIWSGNDLFGGGLSPASKSVIIREKINKLILHNKVAKKKFQLHFSNLPKITKQITDIKM